MMLVIGGCGMKEKDNKQDQQASVSETSETSETSKTVASTDEFTQKYIDSSKEVKDGYYLFKSKTNGYTMLFPINGKISNTSVDQRGDHYEGFTFGAKALERNLSYYFMITYEDSAATSLVDGNLKLLSAAANYEGDYETFTHNSKTYYYAKSTFMTDEIKHYQYFSFIKSDKNEKGLRYYLDVSCIDENKECLAGSEELEEEFLSLIKSVDFLE